MWVCYRTRSARQINSKRTYFSPHEFQPALGSVPQGGPGAFGGPVTDSPSATGGKRRQPSAGVLFFAPTHVRAAFPRIPARVGSKAASGSASPLFLPLFTSGFESGSAPHSRALRCLTLPSRCSAQSRPIRLAFTARGRPSQPIALSSRGCHGGHRELRPRRSGRAVPGWRRGRGAVAAAPAPGPLRPALGARPRRRGRVRAGRDGGGGRQVRGVWGAAAQSSAPAAERGRRRENVAQNAGCAGGSRCADREGEPSSGIILQGQPGAEEP